MEPVHDIRLLLAILAPLIGAGLVMATGKRPNIRETCSFLAAATLFIITASMIPGHPRREAPLLLRLPPVAGVERRVAGGCAFHGLRGLRLVPVDSHGVLLGRIHARARGARANPFQHLLRPGSVRRHRLRLLRQPADALSVLRDRQHHHLSAGRPSPGRGKLRGRQEIPDLPDRHCQGPGAAGDGADLHPTRGTWISPTTSTPASSRRMSITG